LQCLAEMTLRDDPGIHLITVEDPVESPIFGAIQTPLMEEWPEDALRQRRSVIARRQYCQQTLQVELIGRSEWMNQFRQRLQQL
ncbi:hypothetical protein MJH54_34525, partial [Salmonella enterica subsp. enterica serovar Montevideo]|nr:hypothetical protein [Salmonella enterica subsp. enterica serovar Montevideo]